MPRRRRYKAQLVVQQSCGKFRYETELDAQRALRNARKLPQSPGRSGPRRVYFHKKCKGWHLTSELPRTPPVRPAEGDDSGWQSPDTYAQALDDSALAHDLERLAQDFEDGVHITTTQRREATAFMREAAARIEEQHDDADREGPAPAHGG